MHAPVDLPKATQRLTALSRLNGFFIKRTYEVEGGGGNGREEKEKLNAREREGGLGHAHNMYVSKP